MMKKIILSTVVFGVSVYAAYSGCNVKKEYQDGITTAHTGTVTDYARGTATEHTAMVTDYFDEVNVVKHTGEVTDYTKGSVRELSGETTDYTRGTATKGSASVIDYDKGTSVKKIGHVTDYMDSISTTQSKSVTDYATGDSVKHSASVVDYQTGSAVSHNASFTDYARGSGVTESETVTDYADGTAVEHVGTVLDQTDAIYWGKCFFKVLVKGELAADDPSIGDKTGVTAIVHSNNDPRVIERGSWHHLYEEKNGNVIADIYSDIYIGPDCSAYLYVDKSNKHLAEKDGSLYVKAGETKDFYTNFIPDGSSTAKPWGLYLEYENQSRKIYCPPGYSKISGKCEKSIVFHYYEYTCKDGYTPLNPGYTTYDKNDLNNSLDNHNTLDDAVNSSTPPAKNCRKDFTYDYTEYTCPEGYTSVDSGATSESIKKTDNNTSVYGTSLDFTSAFNSPTPPANNCSKDVNYLYYTYACPSGYAISEDGSGYSFQSDPDAETENNAATSNSATPPIGNCYKTIDYNFYEYICDSGYTAKDRGKTSFSRTDPDKSKGNIDTLSANANPKDPKRKNCSKEYSYNYYGFDCPAGYVATTSGLTTSTRSDPNIYAYNRNLGSDANSLSDVSQNCSKDVKFNMYEYKCPTGYTREDAGLASYMDRIAIEHNTTSIKYARGSGVTRSETVTDYADGTAVEHVGTVLDTYRAGNSCDFEISSKKYNDGSSTIDTCSIRPGETSYCGSIKTVKIESDFQCKARIKIVESSNNVINSGEYSRYIDTGGIGDIVIMKGENEDIQIRLNNNSSRKCITYSDRYNGLCQISDNFKYYEYTCKDGYTPNNPGITTYQKEDIDLNIINLNTLNSTVNSSTPPAKNCRKDFTYDYTEYTCPEGYTSVDSGATSESIKKTDNNTSVYGTSLDFTSAFNSPTPPANNCSKDVINTRYTYACPSGYVMSEDGSSCLPQSGATIYRKSDSDKSKDNTVSLSQGANSATPPSKNCQKSISYDYYNYSCPIGYNTANIGYKPTDAKKDTNIDVSNQTALAKTLYESTSPVKNCSKPISFKCYDYSCPTGFDINDSGYTTCSKNDPDYEVTNESYLSANRNSSTEPDKNCYKDLTFDYYEYLYPSGYNVADKGFNFISRVDIEEDADNRAELSATANSDTPPARNASKSVSYKHYTYNCPSGFDITTSGEAVGTKSDPEEKKDNSAILAKDLNSPVPPEGNCHKDINYNFYSYSCMDSKNSQGYNWKPSKIGISSMTRTDDKREVVNSSDLSAAANNNSAESNNCSREYQECSITCDSPMVYEPSTGKCTMSYEDDCIKKGMVYSNLTNKCEIVNKCHTSRWYLDADGTHCDASLNCLAKDGKCFKNVQKACSNDNFNYISTNDICEKSIDCASTQYASGNVGEEKCTGNPYCKDGDTQLDTKCKSRVAVSKTCAPYDRSGNLCYVGKNGTEKVTYHRKLNKIKLNGGFKVNVFEDKLATQCSANPDDCTYKLTDIYAKDDKTLCFKDSQGVFGCVNIDGNCTISGNIHNNEGIRQLRIENSNSIVAYNLGKSTQSLGSIESSCTLSGKVGDNSGPYMSNEIIGIKTNGGEMEFWDEFHRGFIGVISFLPIIPKDDIKDGFVYPDKDVMHLYNENFTAFYSKDGTTYAVYNGDISKSDCIDKLNGTNFYLPVSATNDEDLDVIAGLSFSGRYAYNYLDGITNSGTCVVKSELAIAFSDMNNSVKVVNLPDIETEYKCSPLSCKNGSCQYNTCESGFLPNVYKQDYFNQVISKLYGKNITNDSVCTGEVCDSNLPYFPYCGNVHGCSAGKDIFQQEDGTCVKVTCDNGEKLDAASGTCVSIGCVDSVEKDGKCYKTLNL